MIDLGHFGILSGCECLNTSQLLVNVAASPQGSTTPRGSSTTGVRSKVGSMDNATHTPGGGKVSSSELQFFHILSDKNFAHKMTENCQFNLAHRN